MDKVTYVLMLRARQTIIGRQVIETTKILNLCIVDSKELIRKIIRDL